MNKADIETYFRVREALDNQICDIANYLDRYDYNGRGTLVEFNEDDGIIHAEVEHPPTCGCCGPDYVNVSFPTKLLYTENWKNEAESFKKKMEEERNKKRKEKKKKEEENKKKSIEVAKKKKEERDRIEYIRLKAKFES